MTNHLRRSILATNNIRRLYALSQHLQHAENEYKFYLQHTSILLREKASTLDIPSIEADPDLNSDRKVDSFEVSQLPLRKGRPRKPNSKPNLKPDPKPERQRIRNPKRRAAAQEIRLTEAWLYDNESRVLALWPTSEQVLRRLYFWRLRALKEGGGNLYNYGRKGSIEVLRRMAVRLDRLCWEVQWKIDELEAETEMLVDLCLILGDPNWDPGKCVLSRTLRGYEGT
ncbi:hypothetical protein QBC43DRAFT_334663 [Cladorrhinum sp. PSN259]|nr:hypothetical protein QBC43DRAFT_334663 [Cladorrhinum sp. PSN259]